VTEEEEPWPRWQPEGFVPVSGWDHEGCDHDGSLGDQAACSRLNRNRRPGGAEPDWKESVALSHGDDHNAFLHSFIANLIAEKDCHYGDDHKQQMIAECLIQLASWLHDRWQMTALGKNMLRLFHLIAEEYAGE
jgi:hypothetical protein